MKTKLTIAALLLSVVLFAENMTIMVMDTNMPYDSQYMFYSGGHEVQKDEIMKHWEAGRRITSVAYTDYGWLFVTSTNSGISMQTYTVSPTWPDKWIGQCWNDGYRITSCACSGQEWVVVMSQNSDYGMQTWARNSWDNVKGWIGERWNERYRITDVAFDGEQWVVVMSTTDKIGGQGYFFEGNDVVNRINREVYNNGNYVQMMNHGGGQFLVVFCTYTAGGRGQQYVIKPANVLEYVGERWQQSMCVSYVGGGDPYRPVYTAAPTQPAQPQQRPATNTPGYNHGYTVIRIGGVDYSPGYSAYLESNSSGRSASASQSNGHVTQAELNAQADREARAYQEYKKNPSAWSSLYWQSSKKVLDTYQQNVKH